MALSNFNFSSNIKTIQNQIIGSYVKGTSNLELMRSEEAIQDVIRSYIERFRAAEGMLTDVSKYVAEAQTVIELEEFNKLFESLYIDLAALYNELELVETILTLNLTRNKNYFSIIKKRIKELWQRLRLTRLNIYDLNPADESFYESFYSNISIESSSNISIDKKLGFVYLKPTYYKTHNKAFEIKNISSTVYPVENEEAGVLITTNVLNSFSGNYDSGPRDMLENGLWKEEVYCSDIPDMIINIGSSGTANEIKKTYRGVVAIVDIAYTYPVEMNRLDIDIFGEKALDLDAVLYKEHDADTWKPAKEEILTPLDVSVTGVAYNTIGNRGFDVLSFMNISYTKAKHLRLVFNQKNYSFIGSPNTTSVSVDKQIEKDLSERRYDLVKFNASLEQELTTPVNEENKSLYSKIMSVVESTRDLEEMLLKISDILVPPLKIGTADFGKAAKFEIGAWSIEPKYEEYISSKGTFKSKPFKLLDRHLIGASLIVDQDVPELTSSNWYISAGGKDIPVVEGSSFNRKEPIHFISVAKYDAFDGWPGNFALLDLPIDPIYATNVGVYENGIYRSDLTNKIIFLNSRLIYFPTLLDAFKKKLMIRYQVARYNCCNLYVLQPRRGGKNYDMTLGLCSTRREMLEAFVNTVTYTINADNKPLLSEDYTITNALATTEEAKDWFGVNYTFCIFMDSYISSSLSSLTGTLFESITNIDSTKVSIDTTIINGHVNGNGNLDILSNYINIIPFSQLRTV